MPFSRSSHDFKKPLTSKNTGTVAMMMMRVTTVTPVLEAKVHGYPIFFWILTIVQTRRRWGRTCSYQMIVTQKNLRNLIVLRNHRKTTMTGQC